MAAAAAASAAATDQQELEVAALRKELAWLLREDMPSVFMQLGVLLKEDIKLLTNSAGSSRSSTPPSPVRRESTSRTPLPLNGIGISGTACIEGVQIVGAELRIDLPQKLAKSSKSNVFVTGLVPTRPWLVTQLQDLLNTLELAYLELQDASQVAGATPSRQQASHIMERMLQLLLKAQRSLIMPEPQPLSQIMGTLSVLNPAPPPQMIVDIFVEDAKVGFKVCFVNALAGPPTAASPSRSSGSAPGGQVFQNQNRWYETASTAQATVVVPSLQTIQTHVAAMLELAQRAQDKLAVFSGVP